MSPTSPKEAPPPSEPRMSALPHRALGPRALRRALPALLLLLLGLVGVAVAAPPLRASLVAALRPAGTKVLPERHLREWDPVTVFLSKPSGPASGGVEDHPERWVTMHPARAGQWRWVDNRTLQFEPAEPWEPLAVYTVTVEGDTTALATLAAPPVETDPTADETRLEPVDTLSFTFAARIEPEALARMLTLELRPSDGGPDAPVRWIGKEQLTVKLLDAPPRSAWSNDTGSGGGDASPLWTYVVTLREPVPMGTSATAHLRLSRDEAEGQDAEVRWRLPFSTAAPFRLLRVACNGAGLEVPLDGGRFAPGRALACGEDDPALEFSAPLAALSATAARDLVEVDPRPPGLDVELQGPRVVLHAAWDPTVRYRLALRGAALSDRSGRPLQDFGRVELSVGFTAPRAMLRWAQPTGVLERYGPKQVPVSLAGVEAVDLRLWPVDAADPRFWPWRDEVEVAEQSRPPGPGEAPPTPTTPDPERGGQALQQHLRALGPPVAQRLVSMPPGSRGTVGLDLAPLLAAAGGADRPGTWLVGIRRPDGDPTRAYMRVQITDLVLTAAEEDDGVRFFVTSYQSGRPVAGAELTLEGWSGEDEPTWTTLVTLRTGGDGSVRWKAPGKGEDRPPRPDRLLVRAGADTLTLDLGESDTTWRNGSWSTGITPWFAWAFRELDGRRPAPTTTCHLWTERPVYRPEDPIHVQGWVRTRDDQRWSPVEEAGLLAIEGPGGQKLTQPADTDAQGGFYVKLPGADRTTGTWSFAWSQAGGGGARCRASVRVDAYRLPTFAVELSSPADVPGDRPATVGLLASYYAGGHLAGRPVRWRVSEFPTSWQPPGRAGFAFSSDDRYSGLAPLNGGARLERFGQTDASGAASLSLNPATDADPRPRTWVVEATVTGAEGETVTTTRRVEVRPSFVLGVAAPRYLEPGRPLDLQAVAVGGDGSLRPGVPVELTLSRREWHSVLVESDLSAGTPRYHTEPVDLPVSTTTLTTGAVPTRLSLPLDRAGVWVVTLRAKDRVGRAQSVSVDLYAAGTEALAWKKPDAGAFTTTPDQPAYDPGQTAKLVVQSPFAEARALVVTEAPTGNRYAWYEVRGGNLVVPVAVEKGWAPRVPVHVLLMRGRTGAAGPLPHGEVDLDKPTTVASTTWLTVNPVENRVAVSLQHPPQARPGETLPVTIQLRTPAGAPLAGHVALWLVDQAVLSLGTEQRLDPLPSFLLERASRLLMHDTRRLAFGRLPLPENPGGDGPAEGNLLEKATVRRNLQVVPYYEHDLVVPASGSLTVQVPLSDDLTTFAIRAKASAGPDRFGTASSKVDVRLPLVAQASLPRFLRPGDRVDLVLEGRVVEGAGGAGHVRAEAKGLQLGGAADQVVTLDPAKPARVTWSATVPDDGRLDPAPAELRLGVRRDADGATDAVALSLPVRLDAPVSRERALLTVAPGATVEVPALSESPRPGSADRRYVGSADPLWMRVYAAAGAIRDWPHGTVDAELARARAWLSAAELEGVTTGSVEAQRGAAAALTRAADATKAALDGQGLVALAPGAPGRVWLTADAYTVLAAGRAAGHPVPVALLRTLEDSLRRSLRSDSRSLLTAAAFYERARALQALASGGQLDSAYLAELVRSSTVLDVDTTASIALAGAGGSPAERDAVLGLLPRLDGAIRTRLANGVEVYDSLSARVTEPRVLPSESRSLARLLSVYRALLPSSPRLGMVRDALLAHGGPRGWGSPAADAEALGALADELRGRGPGEGWKVQVADHATAPVLEPREGAALPRVETKAAGPTTLQLLSGRGTVEVLVSTDYVPAVLGAKSQARSRGAVVGRSWEILRGGNVAERVTLGEPGQVLTLRAGDIVEDHVQVTVSGEQSWFAITLPFAAGLEPLNPELATAPPEATPSSAPTRRPDVANWRDDHLTWLYETLPAGTWQLSVRLRALSTGTFTLPPARAEALYDPMVAGRSTGATVTVTPGG